MVCLQENVVKTWYVHHPKQDTPYRFYTAIIFKILLLPAYFPLSSFVLLVA